MSRLRTRLLVGSVCLATAVTVAGMQSAGASTHSPAPTGQTSVRPTTHRAPLPASTLLNHGGPVQTAPRVYLDFWGWTTDPKGAGPYLQNLLSKVGGTAWLSTVHQYSSAGFAAPLAGVWSHAASVPTVPTDAQIQAEARAAGVHFGVSTSDVNAQVVVATPTGHSSSGFGTSYCAYHGVVSGSNNTYTDLPYMPDAGGSCGAGIVNPGNALDGVSIVEGHELAEAITDPLLNAWYNSSGAEIGDVCAWTGLANINLNGTLFPMQPLWSNAANACVQ
ncbi:MAG: hypothetical protein ABI140_14690 [Jatrophihabitantaceae bacterium]